MEKSPKSQEINYLFFAVAAVFLMLLSIFHIFSKESSFFGVQIFFLLYSIGQVFLEITSFVLIGYWIRKALPLWAYKIFIGISFLFLLGHFVDFIMLRLMDASIFYAFKVFFAEGIPHFFAALFALNLNYTVIGIIISALILTPLLGVFFYWITLQIISKKPLSLSHSQLLRGVFSIALVLFLLDLGAKPFIDANAYSTYEKTLPLKTTFLSPSAYLLTLRKPITPPTQEKTVLQTIENMDCSLAKKPNIFLFVVETLRGDYITDETAPSLTQFRKDHLYNDLSFANGSATFISWFSIFHANFPYHWANLKKTWNLGSVPLAILRKLGYRIRVYSAAELFYFKMDELIFGRNHELADDYVEIKPTLGEESCYRDQKVIKQLITDIQSEEGKEANVFIVFLDSTHSEYSWPENFPAKFTPYVDKIDYLSITSSKKNLIPVINRYKNSIHYIDHLFEQVKLTLLQEDLFEDAIMVVTGDHGEEFFEDGAMFHGTHINEIQTHVPIYYKFKDPLPMQAKMTSHIDIFPSILHHLTKTNELSQLFDGESIFEENRWPYIFCVKQNGGHTPYEFTLYDGCYRLTGRFLQPNSLYQCNQIEIFNISDTLNQDLVINDSEHYESFFREHFESAFSPFTQEKINAQQEVQ